MEWKNEELLEKKGENRLKELEFCSISCEKGEKYDSAATWNVAFLDLQILDELITWRWNFTVQRTPSSRKLGDFPEEFKFSNEATERFNIRGERSFEFFTRTRLFCSDKRI